MKKVLDIWNKLKMWQQILAVLIIISIAFSLFYVNTKPSDYHLLFSELEAKEAIQIGNELSEMGVEYELQESNTLIQVKTADVAAIRMQLASKGLPSVSGSGFELFDGNQLGSSSFQNEVNYTRALTTTIQQNLVQGIEGIESAQVSLPLIEKKRFYEDNTELEAKVIVEERANQRLTEAQVLGIQNFVAGAAKNLTPENVTVMNQKGEIISSNVKNGESVSGSYTKQEEIKAQMENRIQEDIMKTLSSVFGYDNIKLTVRADINFDEIVQNIEKYDPEGTIVSRQQSSEKNSQTTDGEKEAGIESNGDVIDYELQENDNKNLTSSEKEELIENFEVGKTVETIKKNPELQTLTVSVYVDETQISVDKLANLEKNIAFSAGLVDEDKNGVYENGDITVNTYEFKKTVAEGIVVQEETKDIKNFIVDNKVLLIILGVLVLVVVALVVVLAIVSSKKKKEIENQQNQLEQIRLQKAVQEQKEIEESVDFGTKKEDKIKRKILDESIKLAHDDTNKTIEFVKKSLNER